jgi:hypothetical protein
MFKCKNYNEISTHYSSIEELLLLAHAVKVYVFCSFEEKKKHGRFLNKKLYNNSLINWFRASWI